MGTINDQIEYQEVDFLTLGKKESSQGKHLIVIIGGNFFIWAGTCFKTPLAKNISVTPTEMNELAKEKTCFICSAPDTDAAIDMYMGGSWKGMFEQAAQMSEIMIQK